MVYPSISYTQQITFNLATVRSISRLTFFLEFLPNGLVFSAKKSSWKTFWTLVSFPSEPWIQINSIILIELILMWQSFKRTFLLFLEKNFQKKSFFRNFVIFSVNDFFQTCDLPSKNVMPQVGNHWPTFLKPSVLLSLWWNIYSDSVCIIRSRWYFDSSFRLVNTDPKKFGRRLTPCKNSWFVESLDLIRITTF